MGQGAVDVMTTALACDLILRNIAQRCVSKDEVIGDRLGDTQNPLIL